MKPINKFCSWMVELLVCPQEISTCKFRPKYWGSLGILNSIQANFRTTPKIRLQVLLQPTAITSHLSINHRTPHDLALFELLTTSQHKITLWNSNSKCLWAILNTEHADIMQYSYTSADIGGASPWGLVESWPPEWFAELAALGPHGQQTVFLLQVGACLNR
jgi:hypothetical protein